MTKYTIYAKNAAQWGQTLASLIQSAETIEQIDEIRNIHMRTAQAVKKTHPKIIARIKEIIDQRKSMLAQKP